jgi:hypothetical protein
MTQSKKKEARLDRGTLHTNIILRSRLNHVPTCLPTQCLPALGNCCNKHKCVCCLTKKCTWTNSFSSALSHKFLFKLIAGGEWVLLDCVVCLFVHFFRLGLLSYSNEIVVIVFTWCVCLFVCLIVHFYQTYVCVIRNENSCNSFYLMCCLFDHFIRLGLCHS